MAKFRQRKIDEEMKRELASVIAGLKDPRISGRMVSVVSVLVTKDLRYAKIYVSVFGTEEEQRQALAGLNSSAGFVRGQIGQKMQLRYTPQMNFVLDDSIAYGAHINAVIRELTSKEEEAHD
jgi:ribosome-binding factor A